MTTNPEQIGAYRIDREIGRGGMGIVYRARDTTLGRFVAIKSLPPDLADDPKRSERFLREARVLAALNHPNIATIHHIESTSKGSYLVLEYIDGETLGLRLHAGALPFAQALRYARDMAAALEAAHERGVIHRDLKPFNIMITREGRLKVLDFGLAKWHKEEESVVDETTLPMLEHTRVGAILGTPGYMSPEQARGEPVDRRTDIWSFGAILFEMLSGRRAFPGRSLHDAVAATLNDEPDLDQLPRRLPPSFISMLERTLRKDVDRRLRDIGDVRVELEELMNAMRPASAPSIPDAAPRGNLPPELTSFVGRDQELERIGAGLVSGRLITLIGAGGCGKTRLAVEAARRLIDDFPGGAWLIELASLSDSSLVNQSVADGMDITVAGDESIDDALVSELASQKALIVLDNCEHLLDACAALLGSILNRCPDMRMIATSREPIQIPGEHTLRVPSLSLPDAAAGNDPQSIVSHDAARLFIERARLSRPDFEVTPQTAVAIARICRRLDGIPLAIELAAARVRSMTPDQIVDRLDDQLAFLKSGSRAPVARHRTLAAALDWSHDLLSEPERTVLRRLSVFRRGCTLAAAEDVCAAGAVRESEVVDLLTALVDKSLVLFDARGEHEPRYRITEIVREYAAVKLVDADEDEATRTRHLDYFLRLSREAEPHLSGGGEQTAWIARVARDHDNIRAALGFGLSEQGPRHLALQLAISAHRFWYLRGFPEEGRRWLGLAVACDDEDDVLARARAYLAIGVLATSQMELGAGRDAYQRALDLFIDVGDEERVAACQANLGAIATETDALDEAVERLNEALTIYERLGKAGHCAMVNLNLSALAIAQDDYVEAERLVAQCLPVFEERGDRHRVAFAHLNLGDAAFMRGRLEDSHRAAVSALQTSRETGDERGVAMAMILLARLASRADCHNEALAWAAAAHRLQEHAGSGFTAREAEDLKTVLARACTETENEPRDVMDRMSARWSIEELMDVKMGDQLPGGQ